MKIACTGPNGRVGRLLVKQGVVPLSCDVTQRREVERAIDSVSPDVVLHLAGISNVDYCEQPENWDHVREVNFKGTCHVVNVCQERLIPVGYLSTEHVFSGRTMLGMGGGPYKEAHPLNRVGLNNYALTKIACEALRFGYSGMKIVRTSHLFDWTRLMTEDLPDQGTYEFPSFIHRSYIYLPHFVHNLLQYAQRITEMPSVLHLAGSKTVSQYQFMSEFVRFFHVQNTHIKRRTKEWPTGEGFPVVAPRPHHVGLVTELSVRLGFPAFSYRDGFRQMEKDNVRG